jgi:cellulose synthase/poly-beta-1,6-N-acetylglucosamine synthase-like glycosyltransferase
MDFSSAVVYFALFTSLYLEVFLLITFLEGKAKKNEEDAPALLKDATLPNIAVIVPCFNQGETLAATMNSLLALNYPKEKLEVLAVDDGSTDNTYEVMLSFQDNEQVRIFKKENGGKHSAMNFAFEKTEADIVGCLDADSFVDADALLYMVAHFKDPRVAAVTPSIRVFEPRGFLQLVQKSEYHLSIFLRKVLSSLDAVFITPGPFSFYRRSTVLAVGPWKHGHNTEDLEMGMRLQKSHHKIANETRMCVYTVAPRTLRALLRQRVRWTYGFLRNSSDYRFMFFNPAYGNLGLLVLPISMVSIFSASYVFALLTWNFGVFVVEQLIKFQTVGVLVAQPRFDLFYVNTTAMIGLTAALLVLTFVLISIGKKLTNDKILSPDVPLYLAAYSFLAPVWLTIATWKALTSNSVRWR